MEVPIKASKFYGESHQLFYEEREKRINDNRKRFKLKEVDVTAEGLFAAPEFYQEFHKQNDALAYAAKYSVDDDVLCVFVGQDGDGFRRFVVTYPKQFWKRSLKIKPEERNFFEVIHFISLK